MTCWIVNLATVSLGGGCGCLYVNQIGAFVEDDCNELLCFAFLLCPGPVTTYLRGAVRNKLSIRGSFCGDCLLGHLPLVGILALMQMEYEAE